MSEPVDLELGARREGEGGFTEEQRRKGEMGDGRGFLDERWCLSLVNLMLPTYMLHQHQQGRRYLEREEGLVVGDGRRSHKEILVDCHCSSCLTKWQGSQILLPPSRRTGDDTLWR